MIIPILIIYFTQLKSWDYYFPPKVETTENDIKSDLYEVCLQLLI